MRGLVDNTPLLGTAILHVWYSRYSINSHNEGANMVLKKKVKM